MVERTSTDINATIASAASDPDEKNRSFMDDSMENELKTGNADGSSSCNVRFF
jgi:hypothetical protein